MGFQFFCLLVLLFQQLRASEEKGEGKKVLVVLDLDETLIHQHLCNNRYSKNHDKLCTRAVEDGKWCASKDIEIDDFIHFCIREGVLMFLEKLESLRKEGKVDILIWTRQPSPNAVVHVTTLAHYAGISSQLPEEKGNGPLQLDGKGDIYRWGLISNGSGSKDLSDLNNKNELAAKGFNLNNRDLYDKTSKNTYTSYWKRGFSTDAILENVVNGEYGQKTKNIYIFDDKEVNCLSKETDGISINVPKFGDAGDNFFEIFVKILEENEPKMKQFKSAAEYSNRLLEQEFFDISVHFKEAEILEPENEFFQELSFKTAFANTAKTMKEIISGNKIESYSPRTETTCEASLCPPQKSKLVDEKEMIIASLDTCQTLKSPKRIKQQLFPQGRLLRKIAIRKLIMPVNN